MEEIKLEDSFGYDDIGIAIFNAITEKARKEGVQIGVTWTKEVYDYLFEVSPDADLEEILGLVSDTSYHDLDTP